MSVQLIYFADPMCSWCWGFSPVIGRIAEKFAERARLRLVMGGLRAFNTEPMDADQARMIAGHWHHVNERTGQPFNHAFFERPEFVYDTEPACRAVVTVRGLEPGREHEMLARLHRGFYLENRDVTDPDVLTELASDIAIDPAEFADAFALDATREATGIDFMITQQTGVSGFPTLLAGTREQSFHVITAGYADAEAIEPKIEAVLDELKL